VPTLNVVKGTMRIHQVISSCKDIIHYRDITCVCQRQEGLINCPCFDVKEAILQPEEETHRKGAITAWQPEVITGDHGVWSNMTMTIILASSPKWRMGTLK
ncbi:hypothetical protein GOODEAATRI_017398, partial [Goodea atripinnis]